MAQYRYNPFVSQHHVEWKKFCSLDAPVRLCKKCGYKIHDGQPNYADECVRCWLRRTGGNVEYDFDIAIHINCDHEENGLFDYYYNIYSEYT